MQFNLEGLRDFKTTIIGVLVLIGATVAMAKGMCSFDRWWEIVLIIIALIGGAGAMLANPKGKGNL